MSSKQRLQLADLDEDKKDMEHDSHEEEEEDEEENEQGSEAEEEDENEEEEEEKNAAPCNEYLCPITGLLMEYPYFTTTGQTYEYYAIRDWFAQGKKKDPLTGVNLENLTLIPNLNLRSMIQSWIKTQTEQDIDIEEYRNPYAQDPSNIPNNKTVDDVDGKFSAAGEVDLAKIVKYEGKSSAAEGNKLKQMIFSSESGRLQYHPDAIMDTYVGPSGKDQCTYGESCKKEDCKLGHDVVCSYGFQCKKKATCKFLHPESDSVDPTLPRPKKSMKCKNGTGCTSKNCEAAHPLGKVANRCKFGKKCTDKKCKFEHQGACKKGVECKKGSNCKFLHPEPSSVEPFEPAPSAKFKECKSGVSCHKKNCKFSHPKGTMKVRWNARRMMYTSSKDGSKLSEPSPLDMDKFPKKATKFQFQGQFAFAFTPHPGPWAGDFFQYVDVYMFDAEKQRHVHIGQWSLANHYVKSVCASGKFLVISFWPYDEEAVRALFESGYRERQLKRLVKQAAAENVRLGKTLDSQKQKLKHQKEKLNSQKRKLRKAKDENEKLGKKVGDLKKTLKKKDGIISNQSKKLKEKDLENSTLQTEVKRRKGENEALKTDMRKKAQDAERAQSRLATELTSRLVEIQELNRRLQEERAERNRLRDPIHVYVMQSDGMCKEDWKLVLDYHKGAHELRLGEEERDGTRALYVTVEDDCFNFKLNAPEKILQLNNLPSVPKQLCPDW